MLSMLSGWKGTVEVNGKSYESIDKVMSDSNLSLSSQDSCHIRLIPKQKPQVSQAISQSEQQYRITVKKYMTLPTEPGNSFDFMEKFNHNNPMPIRMMEGTKVKETRGMVYMKLHGLGIPTITCSCCGKTLTNPISRHYGIGPICLSKMGIVRDISDVEGIKEELQKIEWEGWVIKSAIIEEEEI